MKLRTKKKGEGHRELPIMMGLSLIRGKTPTHLRKRRRKRIEKTPKREGDFMRARRGTVLWGNRRRGTSLKPFWLSGTALLAGMRLLGGAGAWGRRTEEEVTFRKEEKRNRGDLAL